MNRVTKLGEKMHALSLETLEMEFLALDLLSIC